MKREHRDKYGAVSLEVVEFNTGGYGFSWLASERLEILHARSFDEAVSVAKYMLRRALKKALAELEATP